MNYQNVRPDLIKLIKAIGKIKGVQPPDGIEITDGLLRFDWWVNLNDKSRTRICLMDNILNYSEGKKEYKQTSFDFKNKTKITRRSKNAEEIKTSITRRKNRKGN